MTYEIRHRWTGAVLFTCELPADVAALPPAERMGLAVKEAVKSGAFLPGADLRGDSFMAWPTPTAPRRTRRDYGAPVRVWRAGTRYTAMPPRSERAAAQWRHDDGTWECVRVPHDGGYTRTAAYAPGPHLGVRVAWGDIPPAVQAQLRASFLADYCPKGAP